MVDAQPRICTENDTHKLLGDFEIQTDHLNSARPFDLAIANLKKVNLLSCGFCNPARPQNKIYRK